MYRRNRLPGPTGSSSSGRPLPARFGCVLPPALGMEKPSKSQTLSKTHCVPCITTLPHAELWSWSLWYGILLISHFPSLNASLPLAARSHGPYLKQLEVNTLALFNKVGSRRLHHVGKNKETPEKINWLFLYLLYSRHLICKTAVGFRKQMFLEGNAQCLPRNWVISQFLLSVQQTRTEGWLCTNTVLGVGTHTLQKQSWSLPGCSGGLVRNRNKSTSNY